MILALLCQLSTAAVRDVKECRFTNYFTPLSTAGLVSKMVDAAFNGAGQSPGLQIWRIEASGKSLHACVNQVHHHRFVSTLVVLRTFSCTGECSAYM